MLKHRLIFGPIMAAAMILILWADGRLDRINLENTFLQSLLGRTYLPSGVLLLLLFIVLIGLGAREMRRMFRAKGIPVRATMVTLSGVIGCTLAYVLPYTMSSQTTIAIIGSLWIAVFFATLVQHSWLERRVNGAILVGGATAFALIYMGLLPGFYLAIRRWHSVWVVAAIIVTVKSCDIGAYTFGRLLGRHKLIVWLSPGKTWEGLVGGVATSALMALGLAALFNYWQASIPGVHLAGYWRPGEAGREFIPVAYPLLGAVLAGAAFGLIGQFGDLTASLFKRDAGLKDSGGAIPGFGGVIDVLDSPIAVAPAAYWALMLLRSVA